MYTDHAENKLIDYLFRGQTPSLPASWYVGLLKSSPGETGSTTSEVSGGSYARVAVSRALAKWAGTQGPGTTVASSGISAETSNNEDIVFPAPTAAWAAGADQVVALGIFDAASGGNMWIYSALNEPKTINAGDAAPRFHAATLKLRIDDPDSN